MVIYLTCLLQQFNFNQLLKPELLTLMPCMNYCTCHLPYCLKQWFIFYINTGTISSYRRSLDIFHLIQLCAGGVLLDMNVRRLVVIYGNPQFDFEGS